MVLPPTMSGVGEASTTGLNEKGDTVDPKGLIGLFCESCGSPFKFEASAPMLSLPPPLPLAAGESLGAPIEL